MQGRMSFEVAVLSLQSRLLEAHTFLKTWVFFQKLNRDIEVISKGDGKDGLIQRPLKLSTQIMNSQEIILPDHGGIRTFLQFMAR